MRAPNVTLPDRGALGAQSRRVAAPSRPHLRRIAAAAALCVAASCGGAEPVEEDDEVVTSASTPLSTSTTTEVVGSTADEMPLAWPEPRAKSTREAIELAKYIPNNALVYIEFRSIDALEEALLRFTAIASLTGQRAWEPVDAMLPLTNAGIDLSRVDRTAPFGIALAPVPGEFVPGLVLVVPAKTDAPIVISVSAMKSRRMSSTRVEGGYVVLQHDQMPTEPEHFGSAPVTEDLPEGFVRGRVAVSAIRPILSPYVRDTVQHMNEQYRLARPYVSDSQLKKLDADALLDQLEVADEIAFGLDLVQDQVDVELRLVECDRVKERRARGRLGVEVDRSILSDLARHIELDDSLSMVFAFDRDTMIDEFREGWDDAQTTDIVQKGDGSEVEKISAPAAVATRDDEDDDYELDEDESPLVTVQRSIVRMLESFEPAAAFSISLEPAKAHVAIYLTTRQPERAREAISLLLSKCDLETWGFEMALPIRSVIDGTLVEDYSVRFDTRRIDFDKRAAMREGFKTFLGDSTLHVKVATSGDHVLLLLGGDTTAVNRRIRAFDSDAPGDPLMAKAVERATRGEAATVVHTDIVQLISQIAGLGAVATGQSVSYTHREIVREVGSDTAQFTFWSAVDGDDELLGATFDLSELARAFEAFKGSGL